MIMEGRRAFGFLLTIVIIFAIAPLMAILFYTFIKRDMLIFHSLVECLHTIEYGKHLEILWF